MSVIIDHLENMTDVVRTDDGLFLIRSYPSVRGGYRSRIYKIKGREPSGKYIMSAPSLSMINYGEEDEMIAGHAALTNSLESHMRMIGL